MGCTPSKKRDGANRQSLFATEDAAPHGFEVAEQEIPPWVREKRRKRSFANINGSSAPNTPNTQRSSSSQLVARAIDQAILLVSAELGLPSPPNLPSPAPKGETSANTPLRQLIA
mmetsp:Transcript_10168/g.21619  ORF Transcript_10168/g.21619 Transcript_10168/m.21619 type:complete len:115 (+) Transcript_10168:190-534(+)